LLRRALRRGIRGAQEIEQSGLPVFATVSYSPEGAIQRKGKGDLQIFAMVRPDDVVIEALRSLRTSLHFGMLDAKTNTILLTSAAPGAGKSFTAVNLATVAAQAGQKVCLIDADMRKGYLRRFFGKEKGTPGLAELLAREKTLDEVLVQGPVEGLSAILSGRFPPNPSELLMRSEFEDLLKSLNDRFDLIIVDSPPVLAVTDPVVIGRYTGATIIVVRHMETMMGELDAVRRTFETSGVKVTGAILNGYKASEGSRYGGQYQYYNYRYAYKTDES
jgi:tyrosine-protein kinase Etk/Wzc